MREVEKAVARFAWSLTRLAARWTGNFAEGRSPASPAATLDEFSLAAERQMGQTLRQLYRVGDQMQSGFLDMAERMSVDAPDPGAQLLDSWEALDLSGSTPKPKDNR